MGCTFPALLHQGPSASTSIARSSTPSCCKACDHSGPFIYIELGWAGKNRDAHFFLNSALCEAMDAGAFVHCNLTISISGVQLPPLIAVDAAYPLRKWLKKPFGGTGDRRPHLFDKLSSTRIVVECAFRRLKARWRCLTAPLPIAIQNVFRMITACVILHNICED